MAGRTMLRFVVVTDPRIEIGRVRIEEGRLIYSGADTETVRGVIQQRARRDEITLVKAFDLILQEGWSNAYLQTIRTEGVST
jgi:hypothetical protein